MKSTPTILITAVTVLLSGADLTSAFTSTQATAIWNNYNNAFYVGNGGNAYYRKVQGGGKDTTDFWYNSEELEMAIDRAARSGSSADKTIVTALVNGFDANFGTDWTGVPYNDDVMWACLAHLRAYFVTGSTQTSWAVNAANNFNWVFNGNHSPNRTQPQYDNTYGGGMWWSTDHSSTGTKNACVNGPAALVAYYCHVIWPTGTGFLSQSQEMYNWEKSHLVTTSGYVYDHYGTSGAVGYDLSYNAGTFIGAGYYLGDTSTAGLVATYFMNNECGAGGILPNYGTGAATTTALTAFSCAGWRFTWNKPARNQPIRPGSTTMRRRQYRWRIPRAWLGTIGSLERPAADSIAGIARMR